MIILLVVATAGCGSDDGASGPDMSAPVCPARVPTSNGVFTCTGGTPPYECSYADTVCDCESGTWYCRPAACPPENAVGGSCSTPGLTCNYGFEHTCFCIDPENRWLCCGGNGNCPTVATETLCCPPPESNGVCMPGSCMYNLPMCRCESFHLVCTPVVCGDGGT